MRDTMMGPNVKSLVIYKVSRAAVPPKGGFADAIEFLTTPGSIEKGTKDAQAWVETAIAAVRQGHDADPEWTDEDIAGMILERINPKENQ